MSPATLITATAIIASAVMTVGVLRLWRMTLPEDKASSPVRVLGAYSPVLTWLKRQASSLAAHRPWSIVENRIVPGQVDLKTENEILRNRVAELEAQAAELKGKATPGEAWSWDWAHYQPLVGRLLLPGAILVLAAVPSWLVVQQQWLGDQQLGNQLRDSWCRIGYLCQMSWPAYFGVIFVCVAGVIGLMVFDQGKLPVLWTAPAPLVASQSRETASPAQLRWSRRLFVVATIGLLATLAWALAGQRPPGLEYALFIGIYLLAWWTRQVPTENVAAWWSQRRQLILAMLLAHLALIGLLASYYGAQSLVWGLAILLIVTAANLFRYRQQIHPVFWIISAAVFLYTLGINNWWFAVIGDEYSFFQYARDIATNQSLSSISQNWFSGQAVYGAHPYFSSVIQAISMKLLGVNNFGWRFSSLYLSALAIGLFYYFFRTFVQRRAALIASFLLAVSYYIMSFGKIGYNNLQALFALGLVLAAGAWVIRSRAKLAYVGLGLALVFCLYVYPAAWYAIPLPWLLLWIFDRPRTAAGWRDWGLTGLTALILIAPLMLQPGYWGSKLAGTLFNNPDNTSSFGALFNHLSTNLLYSLFSFWFTPEQSHFVVVSYVDPLSAVFVMVGLACMLREVRRERFAGFQLAGFGLFLFLVGASHDRQFPSATRMFMLLPWWTLMAAVGLCWLLDTLQNLGVRRAMRAGVLTGLLAAVAGLNLYQAYQLSYQRALSLSVLETLYLRLAQHVHDVEGDQPKTFVFVTDPDWGIDGLYLMQAIYGVPTSRGQLTKVVVDKPVLPDPALTRLADPDTLVILKPWLPDDWQQALGKQLQAIGKEPCPVRSHGDHVVFSLWHSPELASLCP